MKDTAQRDIKLHDRHARSSTSPTTNEHGVRYLGQTLQPHFSPSIPRGNSTRYLQDTRGVLMATLRNKSIYTPGLAPCEDSNSGTCRPQRWLSGLHTPLPLLATELPSYRESDRDFVGASPISSSPTPLVMSEDGEPTVALAQTTASETTHEHPTGPITWMPSAALELPGQAMSAADLDRQNAKLKTILEGKIPRRYRKRAGKRWRDSDVLLAAAKYTHSLGNQKSRSTRGPILPSEKCKSQLLATLQATIPEHLQKIAEAQVKAEGSTTWKNAMMIAANLYIDQLKSADARLGEDTVQSLETEEAEEWNGFPNGDEGGEDARLTEAEWRRILEQPDEQSSSIKAFEEVLANAEDRRLWIGNLNPTATARELEGFFSGYHVESITFPSKRERIRRRYGFVNLRNADEAGRAICELSGKQLLGHTVTIDIAHHPISGKVASQKREARRISEAQVENALSKMEQWCNLWLSGKIAEDQWHAFSDCLELE
jgi:hypothetical protein